MCFGGRRMNLILQFCISHSSLTVLMEEKLLVKREVLRVLRSMEFSLFSSTGKQVPSCHTNHSLLTSCALSVSI